MPTPSAVEQGASIQSPGMVVPAARRLDRGLEAGPALGQQDGKRRTELFLNPRSPGRFGDFQFVDRASPALAALGMALGTLAKNTMAWACDIHVLAKACVARAIVLVMASVGGPGPVQEFVKIDAPLRVVQCIALFDIFPLAAGATATAQVRVGRLLKPDLVLAAMDHDVGLGIDVDKVFVVVEIAMPDLRLGDKGLATLAMARTGSVRLALPATTFLAQVFVGCYQQFLGRLMVAAVEDQRRTGADPDRLFITELFVELRPGFSDE